MKKRDSEFTDNNDEMTDIKKLLKQVLVHNQTTSKDKMYLPMAQDPNAAVPANK